MALAPLLKISWARCLGLFLDSQFTSIDLYVYPCSTVTAVILLSLGNGHLELTGISPHCFTHPRHLFLLFFCHSEYHWELWALKAWYLVSNGLGNWSSRYGSVGMNQLVSMRTQVQFLAPHCGSRIPQCCEVLCRLQPRLGSRIAVTLTMARGYIKLHFDPLPGNIHMMHMWPQKEKKNGLWNYEYHFLCWLIMGFAKWLFINAVTVFSKWSSCWSGSHLLLKHLGIIMCCMSFSWW